jgi:CxxC motif-containing protein (DUF1111 family)
MKLFIKYITAFFVFIIVVAESCRKPEQLKEKDHNEYLSGGAQTVFDEGAGAFSNSFMGLSPKNEFNHEVGDGIFDRTFVSAPSPVNPGLGPVFNGVSCASCHVSDGRGHTPAPGEQMISLLMRISVPGENENGGPAPVPGYGEQLQQRAIVGAQPEAYVDIQYSYQTYSFPDGETYELRTPSYTLQNGYTAIPSDIMISPRIAPPMIGLGLLEAIPEEDILAREDINDANADGFSGKANYVWDVIKQKKVIGRFGWKAAVPSLLQQAGFAFSEDIGITNFIYKNESNYNPLQGNNSSNDLELSDSLVHAVAFYIKTLAVPARRNIDAPEVKKGKQVFKEAKCANCHVPMSKTAVNVAFPELSNQTIFPYSDLLLHNMGTGLSDKRKDNMAEGYEWRTRPLWGIGLTKKVNGYTHFLHDGRARNFLEAIMWHGGEAAQSAIYVGQLSTSDRHALVKFLESL